MTLSDELEHQVRSLGTLGSPIAADGRTHCNGLGVTVPCPNDYSYLSHDGHIWVPLSYPLMGRRDEILGSLSTKKGK